MRPEFKDQCRLDTAGSVRLISPAPAYEITYYGSYALEEYLASGAESRSELMRFWQEHLLEGNAPELVIPHIGCSGFTARDPEGHFLLCHDLDTPGGVASVLLTDKTIGLQNLKRIGWGEFDDITRHPADALSLAVCTPYMLEDGINAHGLGIVTSSAWGSFTGDPKTRVSLYANSFARAILDTCRDLSDVYDFLDSYILAPREAQVHFLAADSQGRSAVIEYVDGGLRITQPEKNYQVCSNFVLWNNPLHAGKGADRYTAYDKALTACGGVISKESAMELLWQNHIEGEACFSAVFDLTARTAALRFNDGTATTHRYSINS